MKAWWFPPISAMVFVPAFERSYHMTLDFRLLTLSPKFMITWWPRIWILVHFRIEESQWTKIQRHMASRDNFFQMLSWNKNHTTAQRSAGTIRPSWWGNNVWNPTRISKTGRHPVIFQLFASFSPSRGLSDIFVHPERTRADLDRLELIRFHEPMISKRTKPIVTLYFRKRLHLILS